MVDATVDNTPVTILLSDNETYTPASGSVQKVTVVVPSDEALKVSRNATTEIITNKQKGQGEPNVDTIDMVIDQSVTLTEGGQKSSRGIYISGFEVN
jgi:hypothetical protein